MKPCVTIVLWNVLIAGFVVSTGNCDETEDFGREMAKLKKHLRAFIRADEEGNLDAMYQLLASTWAERVPTVAALAGFVDPALALKVEPGMLDFSTSIQTVSGQRIARSNLFVQPEGSAEQGKVRTIASFVLIWESNEWRILHASPCRLQPLFHEIFHEYISMKHPEVPK